MALSQVVAERLDNARLHEADYMPNESMCRQLGEKTLVMVVGPAAIGKTTVMERATELDNDFRMVPVFTTREPRPDDAPGMFRSYPHNDEGVGQLLNKIERQEVVNYTVHPTQGSIYGTELRDYPGRYNFLATLSNAVEQLRRAPFKQTHVVGLATAPDTFARWFDERYPERDEIRARRLSEAAISLEWLLSDKNQGIVTWVENTEGKPESASRAIIDVVKHGMYTGGLAREHARAMKAWVETAAK